MPLEVVRVGEEMEEMVAVAREGARGVVKEAGEMGT